MGIHTKTANAVTRTLIGASSYALVVLHAVPATANPMADANRSARLPELHYGTPRPPEQSLSYEPADMGTADSYLAGSGQGDSSLIEVRATRQPGEVASGPVAEHQSPPSSGEDAFVLRRRETTGDGRLQVESALGDQKLNTNPVVGSGYRISLPHTTMRGISASGASADSQINWSLGKTGQLEGAAQKSFVADGASVVGVGLNRRLFDGWQIGAQTWVLKGDDGSIDPSLASAIHYTTGVSNHDAEVALRTLVDDEDSWGVMLDGEIAFDRLTHRSGLFRLEPEVNWAGQSLPSDAQGAYWHTAFEMDRRTLRGGLEAERNNIRHDPGREGMNVTRAFSGFSERLSEDAVLTGDARSEWRRNVRGLLGEDQDIYRLELSLESPLVTGPSRLAVSWTGEYRSRDRQETVRLSWEQNWLDSGSGTLRSRIDLDRTGSPEGARYRPVASMAVARRVGGRTEISGTAFYTPGQETADAEAFPADGCAAVDSCAHGTGSSIWLALNKEW